MPSSHSNLPKLILVFLAVDWPIFMRRPMLYALAESCKTHGSTVVAINRPLCPLTTALRKRNRIPELFKSAQLEQLADHFYLYSPRYFLHDHLAAKIPGLQQLNLTALRYGIRSLQKTLQINEPNPVVWYYYPQQGYVSQLFSGGTTIYDLYDFPGDIYGNINSNFATLRTRASEHVDLLLTASHALQNEYAGDYKTSILIGNGLEAQAHKFLLDGKSPIHQSVLNIQGPRIGYAGMISQERLHWKLLLQIANAKPEWSFVFAGRIANQSCMKYFENTPNFHYIGEVEQCDVPSVVRGYDVGIMPYLETEFFRCSNPLKFYEFAGAGVPMVSSGIDELRQYQDELITVANPNSEDWISSIESQLKQDKQKVMTLGREVASNNLWSNTTDRLLNAIAKFQI